MALVSAFRGFFGGTVSCRRSVWCLPWTSVYYRGLCTKLFVGGLSYDTNEKSLKDAFSPYGNVMEVRIIVDRHTGRSKGFGFVQFASEAEADNALKEMDGQPLDGRNIRVDFASGRPQNYGPLPPRAVGPPPGLNRETSIEGLDN